MQTVYLSNKHLSLSKRPLPTPGASEALIKVTLSGICATDIELIKGYYDYDGVLGHEFVGVVERCEADRSWEGQRVVGNINISPHCDGACKQRCPEQCPKRVALGIIKKDGVFASHVTLPLTNLHRVPPTIRDDAAVFAEPLAAALRITEQIDVRARTTLVIGAGRLGLLIVQALRARGASVSVAARRDASLELPRRLGFEGVLVEDVADRSFEIVVDATGNADGLRHAVRIVRANGTIVMKSTYADATLDGFGKLLSQIVVNEIRLIGSRCGPLAGALHLLADGKVDTTALIDAVYPLDKALEAFEHATRPGTRKILLRP